MNKTRVISHKSIHPCPKHKAFGGPSPSPSLRPDTLSPASRTERLANSFRQAWDQGCIQAGSAPSAARSGRQTRATARKQPLLPRTLIQQPQGLPSHGNPRNITIYTIWQLLKKCCNKFYLWYTLWYALYHDKSPTSEYTVKIQDISALFEVALN